MTQNRNRSRLQPATGWLKNTFGYAPNYPRAYGTSYTATDYSYVAGISDIVDPGIGTFNAVNSIYHYKQSAGCFRGTQNFSFTPPDPFVDVEVAGSVRYWAPPNPSVPNWGGLVDELAATLAGRSKRSCMLAITLKELSSTISMFRNPFSLMKPSWRKVAKNHTARTLALKGANVWLEYLYGWKSFYNDLTSFSTACGQSVIDVINNDSDIPELSRFSATQTESGSHPPVIGGSGNNANDWLRAISDPIQWAFDSIYKVNARWKSQHRVFCQADGAVLDGANLTKKLLSNFDLVNWQSVRDTLWEAIPYSFVVDWFVDMRGIWAPLNYAYISHLASGYIGNSTKYTYDFDVQYIPGWSWLWNGSDGHGNFFASPKQYQVPTSFRNPICQSNGMGSGSEYWRNPGMPPSQDWYNKLTNRGLSLTQLASGLSLVAQRIL